MINKILNLIKGNKEFISLKELNKKCEEYNVKENQVIVGKISLINLDKSEEEC